MDGLIVMMPFARRLVKGFKKSEFRKTPLPRNKMKRVYILNKGRILGSVVFVGEKKLGYRSYQWNCIDAKQFDPPKKYHIKKGCVIWQNDVQIYP